MKRNAPTIFISYARVDQKYALKLYETLTKANCRPWLDCKVLKPGQLWNHEITSAIRESDYFLAVISTRSVNKRGFFQKEINEALKVWEEIPYSRIYLIPVRIDDCEITSPHLKEVHWVDLFPDWNWNSGVRQILDAVSSGRVYDNWTLAAQLKNDVLALREARRNKELQLWDEFTQTGDAITIAHQRAEFANEVLSQMMETVCQKGGTDSKRFALVARGGFGRGYLSSNSDIDITFLHEDEGPDRRTAERIFEVFGILLTDAWNPIRALPIINTVGECVEHWREDFNSFVAFASMRLVLGDHALYRKLQDSWGHFLADFQFAEIERGIRTQRFCKEVETAYGNSLNIKYCPGGLLEITHVRFLEKVLELKGIGLAAFDEGKLEGDRAFLFLMQLRESLCKESKVPCVTAKNVVTAARSMIAEAPEHELIERFNRSFNAHRLSVRNRLGFLLALARDKGL